MSNRSGIRSAVRTYGLVAVVAVALFGVFRVVGGDLGFGPFRGPADGGDSTVFVSARSSSLDPEAPSVDGPSGSSRRPGGATDVTVGRDALLPGEVLPDSVVPRPERVPAPRAPHWPDEAPPPRDAGSVQAPAEPAPTGAQPLLDLPDPLPDPSLPLPLPSLPLPPLPDSPQVPAVETPQVPLLETPPLPSPTSLPLPTSPTVQLPSLP